VLESPNGENVVEVLVPGGKPNPYRLMLLELRGTKAFDAPVRAIDPEDDPNVVEADGEVE